MKFIKERFVYTFNGNTSMIMNTRHNLANEKSGLHNSLIECMKVRYTQFHGVGFFFKQSICVKMASIQKHLLKKGFD